MNKHVAALLVALVLLVGLAEIYLALSWDEHLQNGHWNLAFNWSVQLIPEDNTSSPSPITPPQFWSRFFYTTPTQTQTSNEVSYNTTMPEGEILSLLRIKYNNKSN